MSIWQKYKIRLVASAKMGFVTLLVGLSALQAFGAEKSLRVGLTGKYPPFNYYDATGELAGFDVETARQLCRRLERPCDFKVLPWDGLLAALLSSKIDVIIGSMAITPEREKQALFSDSYYDSGAQLFVSDKNADPSTSGFRIGVTLGTTYGEFARTRFPQAEVRAYKGDTEVFQDLEVGRLDAMLTDRLVGSYLNQMRGADLKMSGPLLYRERMGIPMRKEDRQLHTDLNRALASYLGSSEYRSIYTKYFGEDALVQGSGKGAFVWQKPFAMMARAWGATIVISLQGLSLGLAFSLLLAFLLIYPPKAVRSITLVYVDFIRSTPFMIQLFAIYFGLPALGITLSAWTAALIAIALHLSAYLSETLKVAYQSIPLGQQQAAQVLGLTPFESLRKVVFPQMLPLLTAPTLNTLVAMIKDSAIVSVISVHELTMQTQQLISSTFRPIEFYAIAAVLYALITYPLLILGRRMEIRYRAKGLLHGGS